MAWFKKKDDDSTGLPDLPELDSPQTHRDKSEKSYLPSFPPTQSKQEIRPLPDKPRPTMSIPQSEVKRSIEMPMKKSFPEQQNKFQPTQQPQKSFQSSSQPQHQPSAPIQKESHDFKPFKEPPMPAALKKGEPIFVRIDKFESAIENIRNIKGKIDEMESLLTQLRQVNAKEDLELSQWEREINDIKARIESVDNNLFGKLG